MTKIGQIVTLTTLLISGCASSPRKLEAEYKKCVDSEEKKRYLYRRVEREMVCKKEIWGK
jgi:starvation-inducible outer membrane lipoprotein